ncbi:MAG TPA: DNA-directed RNA polymerase subunit omega [candidate division Zixibacteria bacterium]|nr:DNA-directed RNA polymerase subunit omega [candidate division Zixibacteria bacterium]HEQ99701.1 DNA-directed RNA polymerase subunit omega [candidate division Zixibacteria bacterium]
MGGSMARVKLDELDKVIKNRYAAVIVAAKRARRINAERVAKLELMPENDEIDIDPRKVTTRAIEELIDGKIKIGR